MHFIVNLNEGDRVRSEIKGKTQRRWIWLVTLDFCGGSVYASKSEQRIGADRVGAGRFFESVFANFPEN